MTHILPRVIIWSTLCFIVTFAPILVGLDWRIWAWFLWMMILLFFKNALSKILVSPTFLCSNKFVISFSKNICTFFIDFFSNNFIMISLTELFSVLHQNCFVIQTFSSKSNLVRDIFLVITSKGFAMFMLMVKYFHKTGLPPRHLHLLDTKDTWQRSLTSRYLNIARINSSGRSLMKTWLETVIWEHQPSPWQ